jgi:hypothetical protein
MLDPTFIDVNQIFNSLFPNFWVTETTACKELTESEELYQHILNNKQIFWDAKEAAASSIALADEDYKIALRQHGIIDYDDEFQNYEDLLEIETDSYVFNKARLEDGNPDLAFLRDHNMYGMETAIDNNVDLTLNNHDVLKWKQTIANISDASDFSQPSYNAKELPKAFVELDASVKRLEQFKNNTKYLKRKYTTKEERESAPVPINPDMSEISLYKNLNIEQHRAFIITGHQLLTAICAHKNNSPPPKQIQTLIGGSAGTGKSYVVEALQMLALNADMPEALVTCSLSSVAAALIKGKTIHSLLHFIVQNDVTTSLNPLKTEIDKFKNIKMIVMDEISFVPQTFLAQISDQLKLLLENPNENFGGLNIVYLGDYSQLPPVNGSSVRSLNVGNSKSAKTRRRKLEGRLLYYDLNHVIELTTNYRMEEKYAAMLDIIRAGKGNKKILNILNSRYVEFNQSTLQDFKTAPLVTHLNDKRYVVNEDAILAVTEQRFNDLYPNSTSIEPTESNALKGTIHYTSQIFRGKCPVLNDHHFLGTENKTGKFLTHINVFKEMPIVLTINNKDMQDEGVGNGAQGTVKGIVPQENTTYTFDPATKIFSADKLPKCIIVEIKDLNPRLKFPNLPPKHVPIFPHESKNGKAATYFELDDIKYKIRGFAITPAFSVTSWKVQGKTINNIQGLSFNSRNRRKHVYVLLSRVPHLKNLLLHELITINDIKFQKSEEEISADLHQEQLNTQTIEYYNKLTNQDYNKEILNTPVKLPFDQSKE